LLGGWLAKVIEAIQAALCHRTLLMAQRRNCSAVNGPMTSAICPVYQRVYQKLALDRTSTAAKVLILHDVGWPLAQRLCSKHFPGAPLMAEDQG